MTELNRPSSNTPIASGPLRADSRRGHGPSAQTIYNVVVAAYIHDISTRHRHHVSADAGDDCDGPHDRRPQGA